jgi:hypothetical protein
MPDSGLQLTSWVESFRRLLRYDPETGLLYWKQSRGRVSAGSVAGNRVKRDKNEYIEIRVYGRLYKAHQIAWLIHTGVYPPKIIDHEDGDGTNNRWKNLRASNDSLNQHNRHTFFFFLTYYFFICTVVLKHLFFIFFVGFFYIFFYPFGEYFSF